MSMTIYDGITQNGVYVNDMVDNNNDIVYYNKKNNDFFIRLSQCDEDDIKKLCLAIFHVKAPFVPIYAKVLEISFDNFEEYELASKVIEKCWIEAKEFGLQY